MHLVVPRHRRVEAVHDCIEFAAADLVRYLERDHIVRAVDHVEPGSSPARRIRAGRAGRSLGWSRQARDIGAPNTPKCFGAAWVNRNIRRFYPQNTYETLRGG